MAEAMIPSIEAHKHLTATMTACSWRAGWRSLLLRAYDEPAEVEEFTTAPTADQLVVLVTAGSTNIESRERGHWRAARYQPGNLGMTAPGKEALLRWRGDGAHSTLHLHLPASIVRAVSSDLGKGDPHLIAMPNDLRSVDPVIEHLMLSLDHAMRAGLPDLYAETAAHFLSAHLLLCHARLPAPREMSREDGRLRRVEAFMLSNLAAPLSLKALAEVAGLSRFHLLRLFKRAYGETPYKRLTRLRMEQARRLLGNGRGSVTEIAFLCGYENPAHFAAAFRRVTGVSPREYRRLAR